MPCSAVLFLILALLLVATVVLLVVIIVVVLLFLLPFGLVYFPFTAHTSLVNFVSSSLKCNVVMVFATG